MGSGRRRLLVGHSADAIPFRHDPSEPLVPSHPTGGAQEVGWRSVLAEILAAGNTARHYPPFDDQARAREVAKSVAESKRFPWWPVIPVLIGFIVPYGWIWSIGGMCLFGWLIQRAMQRAASLEEKLGEETQRLRNEHNRATERLTTLLRDADAGSTEALGALLARWNTCRPPSLRPFSVALRVSADGIWFLDGHAIRRDDIPSEIPRLGRGGRTVFDKRKASDVDDDLAELNAAAVLSVLIALFSGAIPHPVRVRLMIARPATGELVPWVTLAAMVSRRELQEVCSSIVSATEAIRQLGGDVGRWRNQRITAAREPSVPGAPARIASHTATLLNAPSTAQSPFTTTPHGMPEAQVRPARSTIDGPSEAYGTHAVGIGFGEPARSTQTSGGAVPPAPAYISTSIGLSSATPSPNNVRGEFSTIARKFATYSGDPDARFVAFQAYYSTYAQMAPGQLKFYFKWRNAVRNGEVPRTDLSYIFVHVYELLHLIGANTAEDAALQLERVWTSYRALYPKLDWYLVQWITDLYATELGAEAALNFAQRAMQLGARAGAEQSLVVADTYWAAGEYAQMARDGLALLVGDPRLGENKFYIEHNTPVDGRGWIDHAYCDAMTVADRAYETQHGRTPREDTVSANGLRVITREAFLGAVYDWKRKQVILGKAPLIVATSPAVLWYRGAVRYTENILRAERSFHAKLRGVDVDASLSKALDAHFAGYIRATKPKVRVTIDVIRAESLARESADVRARLLDGIEDERESEVIGQASTVPSATPGNAAAYATESSAAASPTIDDTAPAEHLATGLLTDLPAVHEALARLTPAARALVAALAACGWEAPETASEIIAAASGALVRPLVDAINESAMDAIGDILIVTEQDSIVVQEDFRDEVYWVLNGTLDGFSAIIGSSPTHAPQQSIGMETRTNVVNASMLDTDGFGPGDLRALEIVARGCAVNPALIDLAATEATTPLLLLDRLNDCALRSSFGDIIVDADQTPPIILEDAREYVDALLTRMPSLITAGTGQSSGPV